MDRLLDDIPELEGRLLLYAAGELTADEAAALERDLSADPAAREALEQLRALLTETNAGLGALEAASGIAPRSLRRASDRAVRAVFEWTQVDRASRTLGRGEMHPLAEGVVWRYARWPLAAAAMLVVGLMVWTFNSQPTQLGGGSQVAVAPTPALGADGPNGTDVTAAQTDNSPRTSDARFEQVAALFENPGGGADLLAGGLSEDLAALRLLEEPDYE